MTIKVQDAGTLRTIIGGKARVSGVNRRLLKVKVQDGGTLRTVAIFADPLTASASPAEVSGEVSTSSVTEVNTSSTTASPSGGLSPFTYAWARLSGYTASPNSIADATTNFRADIAPGETHTTTFQVTVTDSVGQTATATVDATFTNSGSAI